MIDALAADAAAPRGQPPRLRRSTASPTTRRRPSALAGDGWVLVGDAATFLDPVFSTGVFLAMTTGERAAKAIDRALARRGRVDAADFRELRAVVAGASGRASGSSCTASTIPSSSRRSARPNPPESHPRGGRHDARRRRRARLAGDVVLDAADVPRRRHRPDDAASDRPDRGARGLTGRYDPPPASRASFRSSWTGFGAEPHREERVGEVAALDRAACSFRAR